MGQTLYGPTFIYSSIIPGVSMYDGIHSVYNYVTISCLPLGSTQCLLLYSAEASVQSDKGSGAGWRLHPLQTA